MRDLLPTIAVREVAIASGDAERLRGPIRLLRPRVGARPGVAAPAPSRPPPKHSARRPAPTMPAPATMTAPDDPPRADAGPQPDPAAARDDRLALKEGGRLVLLAADEIDWIEAADYYAEIHARGATFLHRESMASLERRLGADRFLRIHRSTIVNRQRIRELRGVDRCAQVVLEDGTVLRVARAQQAKIAALLGGHGRRGGAIRGP